MMHDHTRRGHRTGRDEEVCLDMKRGTHRFTPAQEQASLSAGGPCHHPKMDGADEGAVKPNWSWMGSSILAASKEK
jgi:hypothetical protein